MSGPIPLNKINVPPEIRFRANNPSARYLPYGPPEQRPIPSLRSLVQNDSPDASLGPYPMGNRGFRDGGQRRCKDRTVHPYPEPYEQSYLEYERGNFNCYSGRDTREYSDNDEYENERFGRHIERFDGPPFFSRERNSFPSRTKFYENEDEGMPMRRSGRQSEFEKPRPTTSLVGNMRYENSMRMEEQPEHRSASLMSSNTASYPSPVPAPSISLTARSSLQQKVSLKNEFPLSHISSSLAASVHSAVSQKPTPLFPPNKSRGTQAHSYSSGSPTVTSLFASNASSAAKPLYAANTTSSVPTPLLSSDISSIAPQSVYSSGAYSDQYYSHDSNQYPLSNRNMQTDSVDEDASAAYSSATGYYR